MLFSRGDISPASDVLRLLVPLEALVGFALLTASVSWLLGMAERGLAADVPAPTRLRAEMLCAAIDDFARRTGERFHRGATAPTAELLELYARDHLRDVSGARGKLRSHPRTGHG
jgi:hypothetical protein